MEDTRAAEEATPTGPTRATALVLVCAVVALSSIAPFVQLGPRGPSVHRDDVGWAAVFLVWWAPFVATLVAFAASRAGRHRVSGAIGHVALALMLPALHTIAFLATMDVASGARVRLPYATDVRAQVLTLLGALQYLVLVGAMAAALAGRAAERSRRRAAELELARARLASELARARVDALRAQLQPHFLFNTLNSIAVLAPSDPERARTMVRRLSELLRAVLATDERATVPLARELELLAAYVEIQQVRFGDRVRVHVDAAADTMDVPVPPLLLQPLVENAIHHAIADREEGGTIEVRARLAPQRLELSVRDDGGGFDAVARARGHGVGLQNARERLHALYGADHAFDLGRGTSGGAEVRIALPARGPERLAS